MEKANDLSKQKKGKTDYISWNFPIFAFEYVKKSVLLWQKERL